MLLHSIEELAGIPGPVHLAIGVFDGVHLGHQAVIGQAVRDAAADGGTPVVVTFDPHPARVLRPDAAPRLLTSTGHKVQILQSIGVQQILLVRFDQEFASTPPHDFVERLARGCKPLRSISVGRQWAFGKNRAGNLELLSQLGETLGYRVDGVPDVQIDGIPVSSTLIRAAIQEGRLHDAERYLGRQFTILGTVGHGKGLGRELGFPTANLSAHNEQFPPNGVYAVTARIDDALLKGVVNIGVRPTVETNAARLLELHVFDYASDLYGRDVEVAFVKYLRGEKRFESLDALKAQIASDVVQARNLL